MTAPRANGEPSLRDRCHSWLRRTFTAGQGNSETESLLAFVTEEALAAAAREREQLEAVAEAARPVLRGFVLAMEERLAANDHKGKYGWRNDDALSLLGRLREETKELREAIIKAPNNITSDERIDMVVREAADVANFAMMIADHYEDLEAAALAALRDSRLSDRGNPAKVATARETAASIVAEWRRKWPCADGGEWLICAIEDALK